MAYNLGMKERSRMRRAGREVLQRAILLALGLSVWWAGLANAQQAIAPPDETKPIPQWVCAVIFGAFCVAVAFKNPKRTHMS